MSRTLTRATVVLRDARLEDAPALAEVWDGVIRRADRAEQVADLERVIADAERRDDVRVVVAEHDGTLAGAVYLELAPVTPINLEPTVRAVSPHVLPAYRRHGIGRALMDAAVSWAEELGIGLVASAATAGARDANRFMARLALAPTAMLRIAPTSLMRAKLAAQAPATQRTRSRVLSARRAQSALRRTGTAAGH